LRKNRQANFSPRAPRRRCSGNFFEREKRLCNRLERATMDRTGSKFMKSGEVQFGAVALVLVEAILGKLGAKVTHHPVARDLSDDARRRDAQTVTIAIDDGRVWKRKRKNWKTVDQHVVGRDCEGDESDAHRLMSRSQNIDAIDLEVIDDANRPSDLAVRNQLIANCLTQLRSELFGIVQLPVAKFFR